MNARRFSSTRFRLTAGFLSIVGIFGVAVLYSVVSIGRVLDAMEQIERHRDGAEACLTMAANTFERYTHQEHYIINFRKDRAHHLHYFQRADDAIHAALDRVTEDADPDLLARAATLDADYIALFNDKIKPYVDARDTVDLEDPTVQQYHKRSEDLTFALADVHSALQSDFGSRITDASKQVRRLAVWATAGSLILLGVAGIVATVVSVRLGRSIVGPIETLVAGTDRIGSGDLSTRIELDRNDEFGRLAAHSNEMITRLKASQEKLVQSEKLASIGRLAAGVAHEINNPLAVIIGHTKILMSKVGPDDPIHATLQTLDEESQLCKRVVEDLLALSRPVRADRERVDLRELVERTAARVARMDRAEGVEQAVRLPESPVWVEADRDKLAGAISNVWINGCEAMGWCGTMTVALTVSADRARLSIADTGPGVLPENVGSLFDPFFTTKEDGTGLGLSIAFSIVAGHGGSLALVDLSESGACFVIGLPLDGGKA